MDTHVRAGYRVPPTYDSMIAKLIVHAEDREAAMKRADRALRELVVKPIHTTTGLHIELMNNATFQVGFLYGFFIPLQGVN